MESSSAQNTCQQDCSTWVRSESARISQDKRRKICSKGRRTLIKKQDLSHLSSTTLTSILQTNSWINLTVRSISRTRGPSLQVESKFIKHVEQHKCKKYALATQRRLSKNSLFYQIATRRSSGLQPSQMMKALEQ